MIISFILTFYSKMSFLIYHLYLSSFYRNYPHLMSYCIYFISYLMFFVLYFFSITLLVFHFGSISELTNIKFLKTYLLPLVIFDKILMNLLYCSLDLDLFFSKNSFQWTIMLNLVMNEFHFLKLGYFKLY